MLENSYVIRRAARQSGGESKRAARGYGTGISVVILKNQRSVETGDRSTY